LWIIFPVLDSVAVVRRKETGRWGGVQGRHERTPAKLGSGSRSGGHGRARRRAVGCLGSASLHAVKTGTAGWAALFGWASSCQLGRAGVGAGCWVGLGLRPGFGPQSVLLFKIPFLFPNLFIICKLI
jgi:hypothetical protein